MVAFLGASTKAHTHKDASINKNVSDDAGDDDDAAYQTCTDPAVIRECAEAAEENFRKHRGLDG